MKDLPMGGCFFMFFPNILTIKGFNMARQIQIRRGTTLENDNFTGAIGEVTMDTDAKTLRVHDGETVGGVALAKESEIPDIASADYVIEWQNPTAENNYTWYRKYKSGWVEQGGTLNTYPATEESIITFPISFINDCYYADRTLNYYVSAGDWVAYNGGAIFDKTISGMKFRHKGPVSWYVAGIGAK